ncbi:unnamed protein product, partial [Mesorhabditis belari]
MIPLIQFSLCSLFLLGFYEAAETAETIPNFSISNSDILKLADQLRAQDENKAKKGQIIVNFQGHTSTRDSQDNADGKFFTKVDQSLLRKSTYEQFLKMCNNFERQTGIKEPKVTNQEEKTETTQFIDLVFQTKPWKTLYEYFHKNQHPFASDPTTWRYWIAQLWFVHYSRARGLADTSGFEHVFMGEAKNGEVSGMHNWIRMYYLERNSTEQFDYKGFLVKRGNLMGALKFSWHSEMKRSGSLLIGTSPEFDLALYTMCFLSRRGRQTCDVEIDGCNLSITSYDISQQGKIYIGSIFPSAGRMNDKCRQMNNNN